MEAKNPESCQVACTVKLTDADRNAFVRAIDEDYRVHWIVDNLPVGMYKTDEVTREQLFTRGFPVGFKSGTGKKIRHYINNHIRIIIQYHDEPAEEGVAGSKIVGFRVEPMSIKHSWEGGGDVVPGTTVLSTCNAMNPGYNDPSNYQSADRPDSIVFTYDVKWEKSDVEWANRWDAYILASPTNEKVHWFSITNSIFVVLFLTVIIAMILIRALRKDIAQYNDPGAVEEAKEESGWKLVHGDVFRPPSLYPMLFSVMVGTGAQLFFMSAALLTFALFGLLSPDNRGSIVSAFVLLFVFMGAFAGYYSSLTYKLFRGTEWKNNTLLTASFFPGVVSAVVFVLNSALWLEGSSGALPFATFFTLLFLWFCVSVPLVRALVIYINGINILSTSIYLYVCNYIGISGLVFGIQERVDDISSAYKPNPASDPETGLVHESCSNFVSWRYLALRRRVCRALLYHVRAVAASDLLHLRVPVPRDDGAGSDVCRDIYTYMLLSALS